jgi:uncharacterized membrane protein
MSATVTPPAGQATLAYDRGPAAARQPVPRQRIAAIDIMRGLAMVLMAIDHVRVFSGLPAGGPTPGIFFTRWVTHFVAPAFVFLAGTAAFLHGRRLERTSQLSWFLLTRGAWLLLLEMTVIRLSWTFNFDYAHYMLAGVIWMIGWCMILMAGIVHLPVRAIAAFGLVVIFGHNVIDWFMPALGRAAQASSLAWLWQILYFGGEVQIGGKDGPPLAVLFVIVPWIGVMAAGYAFGMVTQMPADRRRRISAMLGVGAIALFLVLRGFDLYGDPRPWRRVPPPTGAARTPASSNAAAPTPSSTAPAPTPGSTPSGAAQGTPQTARPPQQTQRPPALLRFLNTAKYPASLAFLLMTLGPMLALLPLAERARGRVAGALELFGRVPMFYYLLHIPLIHILALGISLVRTPGDTGWLFANHPMYNPRAPAGYTWSLTLLYAVTAVAVAILYVACRWFAGVKQRHRGGFLSYL